VSRLRKVVKWAAGAASFLALTFVLINASDEVLNPELAAILDAKPTVAPRDNAFFYMMGMEAPEGKDPAEAGAQHVEQFHQKLQSSPREAFEFELAALHDKGRLGFVGKTVSCDWRKESCLEVFAQHASDIRRLAEQNAKIMARYSALLRFQHFDEAPYTKGVLVFPLGNVFEATRLDQAVAAVEFRDGRLERFLQRLLT
jgi:hypothetical protein